MERRGAGRQWRPLSADRGGSRDPLMSDFEMLSIVLMFLGILVTVIVAYIQDTKK